MNVIYVISAVLLIILVVSLFSGCGCTELFDARFKKKLSSKKKVKLGFLRDTPGPLKELITEMQKLGQQLKADTKYDSVATNYLDPKNINTSVKN